MRPPPAQKGKFAGTPDAARHERAGRGRTPDSKIQARIVELGDTADVCKMEHSRNDSSLDEAANRIRLSANPTPESLMKFRITALDTSGGVTLQRDTVPAAMKKAAELISDGCWDVEIIAPDGAAYRPAEFAQLQERVGA